MSKNLALYADQILEAITNIYADINGKDLQSFCADRRVRQLVERNLEILSEASRRLPDEFKQKESDIPWRNIAGIGNVLRHDYYKSNPEILWEICRKDLRNLQNAVERIRQMFE